VWWFLRTLRQRRSECAHCRDTLHYDAETGLYHWTTRSGRAVASDAHPDQPGGDWYEEEREALSVLKS